ncbi:SurA N-terminal domain-containing protein [Streptomyces sp. NPDC094448]|uniref:SurA N-terminal domain-containing protein n=1 Tax=Streptomyces sp. NPDC094448 TaxID=3366063 RepID=UPI0037FB6A5F
MHRRRRTAISVSAVLLAAAPLLTACGSEAHPGAAAVIGGQRVEVSTLQAQVADVRAAQAKAPEGQQMIADTGQLGRAKLFDLIVDRVVKKAADDAGITVTRKELQQAQAAYTAQAGGAQALAATFLQQRGVAPDQVGGVIEREVLIGKLAESIGAANTPDGQQKLNAVFIAAAKSLDIDVNPRYGTWDNQKLVLGDYKAPWINQLTRQAPPANEVPTA